MNNAPKFNPNARDGDGDGLVQEGTEFERRVGTPAPDAAPVEEATVPVVEVPAVEVPVVEVPVVEATKKLTEKEAYWAARIAQRAAHAKAKLEEITRKRSR